MKTNKNYVVPQIAVVIMESGDVITNSPVGFDIFDNWKSDKFLPMEDQI